MKKKIVKVAKTHSHAKGQIKPFGDRILVRPFSEEEAKGKSANHYGIIIPETANKEKPSMGKVVAVGKGRMSDEGKLIPVHVKKGDTVLFSKYSGDDVVINGEKYLIVTESNILAVIE